MKKQLLLGLGTLLIGNNISAMNKLNGGFPSSATNYLAINYPAGTDISNKAVNRHCPFFDSDLASITFQSLVQETIKYALSFDIKWDDNEENMKNTDNYSLIAKKLQETVALGLTVGDFYKNRPLGQSVVFDLIYNKPSTFNPSLQIMWPTSSPRYSLFFDVPMKTIFANLIQRMIDEANLNNIVLGDEKSMKNKNYTLKALDENETEINLNSPLYEYRNILNQISQFQLVCTSVIYTLDSSNNTDTK